MFSCIYEGNVIHQRLEPVAHRFEYKIAFAYLDLAELPQLMGQLKMLSAHRFSAAGVRRNDHFGKADVDLATAISDFVASETDQRPSGPVRLLTQLSHFGYYFNPLNLFYGFEKDSPALASQESAASPKYVVAEVTNTPWNERHLYLLWEGNRTVQKSGLSCFRHPKDFHVSPFMGMNADYVWQISDPTEQMSVVINSHIDTKPFFSAAMNLRRRPLTNSSLASMMLRYPMATAKITLAIYYQALRLWKKKCPYFPHPNNYDTPNDDHPAINA